MLIWSSEEYKFDILYLAIIFVAHFMLTVRLRHVSGCSFFSAILIILIETTRLNNLLVLHHGQIRSMNVLVLLGFSGALDQYRVGKLSAAGASAGLIACCLVQ